VIVTVTLNPSLDRTMEIADLNRGGLIHAEATRLDPGGKGVNVARALTAHGFPACAVVPRNGPEGMRLTALLGVEGIDVCAVPVTGHTRSNVSLVEPDGTVTKINERGGRLTDGDLEAILEAVLAVGDGAEWVVASGSLPPGVPDAFYARLGQRVSELGVRFAVDTSGPALPAALETRPALVKPNRDELAESVGFRIDTVADAVRAAEVIREAGAGAVLASLGEDGAVLVDANGVRYGESPVDGGRSAVGAGDAMLAGFLAATLANGGSNGGSNGAVNGRAEGSGRGAGDGGAETGSGGPVDGVGGDALVEALSWGAAAVRLPGSRMPGPSDVDRSAVCVHATADLSRQLSGPHQVHGMEQIR
jgi:1-phosphofructokinase